MKKAKIYIPAKTATQSGRGKQKKWVLEFDTKDPSINPLMGWETSTDTLEEVILKFTTKEKAVEWLRGVYEACKKTDSKYMMLFEEDDFILKPISILSDEFSMAIHPTAPSPTGRMRANAIPYQFKQYAEAVGGIGDSPGYASGGGTISVSYTHLTLPTIYSV